jgi:hypothetical protein
MKYALHVSAYEAIIKGICVGEETALYTSFTAGTFIFKSLYN